jgi:hypothetical protein
MATWRFDEIDWARFWSPIIVGIFRDFTNGRNSPARSQTRQVCIEHIRAIGIACLISAR